MATLGIAIDKDPKTLTAFRSDGETIPFIAAGGEAVGDIVERNSAQHSLGQVSKLANSEDTAATAGDTIHLRIYGMIYAPKAAAAMSDGDMVAWIAGSSHFAANATGAHQVVGGYDAGDTHALIRLNVQPRAAT